MSFDRKALSLSEDQHQQQKKIEDCGRLYAKYGGRRHAEIEREMRALGHTTFHRRILYSRFERRRHRPGWIELYSFNRSGDTPVPNAGSSGVPPGNAGTLACKAGSSGLTGLNNLGPAVNSAAAGPRSGGHAGKGACVPGGAPAQFEDFQTWLKRVSPGMVWDWCHQVYIYKHLRRVTSGKCKRLMLFLPPRHGKSELVTVRYAAWRLKQDPSMNVIIGSYNQSLANRFSRKIKRVLMDDVNLTAETQRRRGGESGGGISNGSTNRRAKTGPNTSSRRLGVSAVNGPLSDAVFPFASSKPANTEAEWETSRGGGLRAVGVGGGVTGYGAQLIIIDDPVKNRAEAESQTMRDRVWDWFNDDIYTRLEPDGAIILIQTRWHEDDLAGRLLREMHEEGAEQWEVVNLPALSEPPASAGGQSRTSESSFGTTNCPPAYAGGSDIDPIGRIPGDALCPERFDKEKLAKIKRRIGSYSFAALYQQRPVPAEGGLFKRSWFKIVSHAPPGLKKKRGYDLALSQHSRSDYTASYRVAFDRDGSMYIDGGFRQRIEYPYQRRYIQGRILAEPDTDHGVELSANGHAVIQDLRRDPSIRGRSLRGVQVKGDKITRALPWIALAEEGRVYLVRGAWNQDFIDEACSFPSGTHDDQIDAVSIAVRMHNRGSSRLHTF